MRKTGANLAMNKTVYDYTAYQYTMVQYYKGSCMFASLYDLYGKEKFERCLQKYCKDNAYKIADKDAFIAAASDTLGDVGGLVEGWLGENAVATTFAVA